MYNPKLLQSILEALLEELGVIQSVREGLQPGGWIRKAASRLGGVTRRRTAVEGTALGSKPDDEHQQMTATDDQAKEPAARAGQSRPSVLH